MRHPCYKSNTPHHLFCNGKKRGIGFLFIFFIFFLFACDSCGDGNSANQTVSVVATSGTHVFNVEIADTPSERSVGLMNRDSLDDDAGMFFIYSEDVRESFWMRNTLIALDIIFIDEDLQIIYMAQNTTPLSEDLITPTASYRYVLEVNAGFSSENGVAVGDRVELNL